MRPRDSRGHTLLEVAIVGLLLVAVAAFLLYRTAGPGTKTRPGAGLRTPIVAAKDAACRANLRTVRQAVEAYRASDPDGAAPASLDVLALPAETTRCAEGNEPYIYDAAQAEVRCPHPGHETF